VINAEETRIFKHRQVFDETRFAERLRRLPHIVGTDDTNA
jgi:hypothetical protein